MKARRNLLVVLSPLAWEISEADLQEFTGLLKERASRDAESEQAEREYFLGLDQEENER